MAIPSRNNIKSQYIPCMTFPARGQPFINGFGGYVTNGGSVSYWADNDRQRPSNLFRDGTSLVAYNTEESNPKVSHSAIVQIEGGTGVTTYELLASNRCGAGIYVESDYSHLTKARNALLEKVKDQSMNLGATLGEYKSTAKTVGDLARSVAGVVSSMNPNRVLAKAVRVRKNNRTRAQKDLVNSWLAYCYGLRPMMSDITNSLQMLNKRLEDGYYMTSSVTGHCSFSKVENHRGSDPFNPNKVYTRRSTLTQSCKILARYKVNSNVKALAEVGITNPLLTAWELVPYSFVFDWIFPVGDYLSSLDALVGVEDFVRVETTKEVELHTATSGHFIQNIYKNRSMPQIGAPSFTMMYRPSTAMSNMANGLALLMQRRF